MAGLARTGRPQPSGPRALAVSGSAVPREGPAPQRLTR